MGPDPAAETRGGRWRRRVLLGGAGLAGALAFPGLDWWPLGWLWLAPVLADAVRVPPRRALTGGWLAGTVCFLVLLRWLDHTFRHYSAIPSPLTWLPIVALAGYCGLYTGLTAAAVSWGARAWGAAGALATAPAVWVAGEWIRGWLMDGFPWALLGYSQHRVLPVIQIAELAGVWGVSFVLVATASALAGWLALGWRRARLLLIGVAGLVALTLGFGAHALATLEAAPAPTIDVGIIQPNVAQRLKWDPTQAVQVQERYERLTREAARGRPSLVLWPETAAPIMLRWDRELQRDLAALVGELATPILVGSIDRADGTEPAAYFNSAFLLTERGIAERYDKIHLVPFGEYVPLGWLIGFVRSWAEFISEMRSGQRPTVFRVPDAVVPGVGAGFGTVICYEVVFPDLFRQFVARGAVFMANITNDAWFGETSGPLQHVAVVPLRAVENRVAIARAANTGVSTLVAPSGRVAARLGLGREGVLTGAIPLRTRSTIYTRFGDWLAYVCAAATAVLGAAVLWRRRG